MPERQPPIVDYHVPQPRRSWIDRFTGWDASLLAIAIMAYLFWPLTHRVNVVSSGPNTVLLMYLLLAPRLIRSVVLRDRSRWWIAYLLLIFALPLIARAVYQFYWTPLGDRIATTMYHFWRDLF